MLLDSDDLDFVDVPNCSQVKATRKLLPTVQKVPKKSGPTPVLSQPEDIRCIICCLALTKWDNARREAHVNACLDKGFKLEKKRSNDVIYVDEKDPDFLSPKATKKLGQGKLDVGKNGRLSVVKQSEVVSSSSSNVNVDFIAGDLDSEISAYRLTIGNIEVQQAELEKQKEMIKKNLSKVLKKRAMLTAQKTVLVGCERRPLKDVLKCIFPDSDNATHRQYKYTERITNNLSTNKPLWDLSKLAPSFDEVLSAFPPLMPAVL